MVVFFRHVAMAVELGRIDFTLHDQTKMSQVKRARLMQEAPRAAEADGFDGVWETGSEDEEGDETLEREFSAAALASTPPTGVPLASWAAYQATVRAVGFSRARAPQPQFPIGRGVPPCTTLVAEVAHMVNHKKTRCVNIKQPWATFIALGLKDVENRTQPLPNNSEEADYCWVAVVASSVDSINAREWEARMRS